ncbi:hypothetical protein B0H21DRAFT_810316 [Amylocystis lapponica]|nr:hypothetical protein B0H21DRAFT_810316 [Amylocystis lapponica]
MEATTGHTNISGQSSKLPDSTFSFTAPFPPPQPSPSGSQPKQRRVSLALPSSPRLFPAWSFRDDTGLGVHSADTQRPAQEKKGKMRRIESSTERPDDEPTQPQSEKKQRKKWTMEETQTLVAGCNKWGVGNWKSILNDPEFKFGNRSPVDLKDRFRTYFPDAYRQHYPNAKTHLSSKVRAALPDGTSIFEKTRSKKRRPFTEEEDRALKAGYDKHGTVWATIVKDPVFQEQNRRSTDLRDRFRNAFPDLYQAAGYKPRTSAKRKGQTPQPVRAATDDQLPVASAPGPVRRNRRHTTQGLFRGGTKSVPESTTCSEDEDSSDGEEETPGSILMDAALSILPDEGPSTTDSFASEMDMPIDTMGDPLAIPDFIPSSSLSEMTDSSQAWSSAIDTPLHGGWTAATNTASPTSSHLSSADYFLNNSPFRGRGDGASMMIGKSAWGTQDWLSPNPRLEPSAASSSSSSYIGGFSPTPSSPFSFAHLNHGVLDRYDLFPSYAHDFASASEVGVGDTHSTFSDPDIFAPSSFRGFTHHSNTAGDLIFGARTHQPHQPFDYGPGFGFGSAGLGLSGMQQPPSAGLHPMQLHTPALPGIDEIELTSIRLDDQVDPHDPMEGAVDTAVPGDCEDMGVFNLPQQTLDELVGLTQELHATPPGTPQMSSRSLRTAGVHFSTAHNRSVSVPPSEHRAMMPRAAQTQVLRPKPLLEPTRSLSLMDLIPLHPNDMLASQVQPPPPGAASSYTTDCLRPPGDNYDLPFLDLHYWTHAGSNPAEDGDGDGGPGAEYAKLSAEHARHGQALDLAGPSKALGIPASLAQHMPVFSQSVGSTPPAAARALSTHHRGQSAVSPQDLLLRKGSDNKRKRSSWDGGAH